MPFSGFPVSLIVPAFIALVAFLIYYGWVQTKKKRQALAAYAAQQSLTFAPDDTADIAGQFADFGLMQQGHSRTAADILWGRPRGFDLKIFEYQYTTGSGKNQTTHCFICGYWQLPVALSPLAIRPESIFDHVAEWFGHSPIEFESAEFNRKYHVRGADPRAVYDLIDPRMMEFIMGCELKYLEILDRRALVYFQEGNLTPARCDYFAQLADGFNRNIPEHVIREKGGTPGAEPDRP